MSTIINATTTNGVVIQPDNSGSLQLATNSGTTAVTIDTSQNVGIGTTSPVTTTARLSIKANGDYDAGLAIGSNSSVNNWARLDFKNNNAASPAIIYQDQVGTLGIRTDGAYPIIFQTNATERMRITSDGEVQIAGTTDRGAFNLQCNGTGVWGAGAYTNGSDERIKDNITPLDTGLDVVAKLNPVTYTYKEDWSRDQSIQTGFIAQDLLVALEGKNYVDGIVNQSSEYMSVAYQNIIPILTKAIQEQQTIINDLKARIETLEAK